MDDATADLFADLDRHAHEALLEKVSGSLRFELTAADPRRTASRV